jgi:ECF transporter, substrate-specific component
LELQHGKKLNMEKEYIYHFIPLAALFSALGLIFPVLFHLLGMGSAFLPMFIPLIMGAVLVPPAVAVSMAVITPVISFLFTGMPPVYPPILLSIILELIIVNLLASILYREKKFSIWLTLIITLAADRLLLFLFIRLAAKQLGFPEQFYSMVAIAYGIPGIILIFIIIPLSLKYLKSKYPQLIHTEN